MDYIGYARVSTNDQDLRLQKDALIKADCKRIFSDHISGTRTDRSGLDEALKFLRPDDVLVVWRLDRLGRSLQHLIEIVNKLVAENIGLKSLTENIDTTTSGGKLVFHIFGALAEFERELIRERTIAGLAAARARGKNGGRPKTIEDKQIKIIKSMYHAKTTSIKDICQTFHISRSTLYRYLDDKTTGTINS